MVDDHRATHVQATTLTGNHIAVFIDPLLGREHKLYRRFKSFSRLSTSRLKQSPHIFPSRKRTRTISRTVPTIPPPQYICVSSAVARPRRGYLSMRQPVHSSTSASSRLCASERKSGYDSGSPSAIQPVVRNPLQPERPRSHAWCELCDQTWFSLLDHSHLTEHGPADVPSVRQRTYFRKSFE